MEERNLQAIDGATLMGLHLEPTRFCVDTLLPQGVCFLGGASKIGKSWMVLDWCVRIAKGEPVWGLPTQKGTTLYLCLEDTLRRVQDRLNRITEEVPGTAACWMRSAALWGSTRTPCWWRWTPLLWCVPLAGTRPTAATIRRCAS